MPEPSSVSWRVARHQEAALALDCRVGNFKSRQECQRHAEHFEAATLKANGFLLAVPDDLLRTNLPQGRLVRLRAAGLASGIDTIIERCQFAADTLGALGCKTGIVGRFDAQCIDETFRKSSVISRFSA